MTTIQSALIFGATRGVGLAICRLLREAGAATTALVRDTSDGTALDELGVTVVTGDALSKADVARAFAAHGPADLVVSTLSGGTGTRDRVDDLGNIHVIDAATAAPVGRFVFVTSLGCGEMRPYMSQRSLDAFGDALLAKTIAEEHLRTTTLPWTILRPGGLRTEPATHRGALYDQLDIHGFIHRDDVALLTLQAAADPRTLHRTLVALDTDLIRSANPANPTPVFPAPTQA